MNSNRAPKQWSLTKNETITTFEAWRQNLQYSLSLDANFCPVISHSSIVKNSTSISSVWQAIRAHYGFQSTGARFLDFSDIKLEVDERPEVLFQRLMSFTEDNLLVANGPITHHGANVTADEEMTPTLENMVVLTWLKLIHTALPALVKQRYGTELRSKTLTSLKPEISQALDSLLEEIRSTADTKVLRTTASRFRQPPSRPSHKPSPSPWAPTKRPKSCPLCKQAGRNDQHFLSSCSYLPPEDRTYLSRSRFMSTFDGEEPDYMDYAPPLFTAEDEPPLCTSARSVSRRSPFYRHYPIQLTLDTGAETSMIKSSLARSIGAPIMKSSQQALQADGLTPLAVVGETRLILSRADNQLTLDALVVDDLDVDVLAGTPFLIANDISVRPAKCQVRIQDSEVVHYEHKSDSTTASHAVRRAQCYTLRAPPSTTVLWPGDYVELDVPPDLGDDCVLALQPRTDTPVPKHTNPSSIWPEPQIVEAVGAKVRLVNSSQEPKLIEETSSSTSTPSLPSLPQPVKPKSPLPFSSSVSIDPDNILSEDLRVKLRQLLQTYDRVFNPDISGYNGAAGPIQASVNIGPVQPPQRKGRVPQYSRNQLVELQAEVFRRPEDLGITVEYLNPSFLVKKPSGGHRLVTAFADVARYSKPQLSLMPDVDSTLRTIAPWRYMIKTDLTRAFYQIPLSKSSLKYCGVATPFRGIRVYTRSAMGMPGSETALEEMMCRVLGDFIEEGFVAKLADDLYCGADSPEALLHNWQRVLQALDRCNLRLSPTKTKHDTLRDALTQLIVGVHPLDGPRAVIRVDPSPGFQSMANNDSLNHLNVTIEVGRVKNKNKNPVAEKAVRELEEELIKQEPGGRPVSAVGLALATARLNSRLRLPGLSSRELWTQRNQFTHEQLPLFDYNFILGKHAQRSTNHAFSEKSKNPHGLVTNTPSLHVGDIVYLISDKDKSRARDRYLVVSIDLPWCFVKKFRGSQLRATSYKVKLSECYAVPPSVIASDLSGPQASQDQDDEPSPVTPALPAASVPPESPAPAPPELTSVPSDEVQFPSSACGDTTPDAPIGVPPLLALQEEPCTIATAPDQALSSCPCSSPESPSPRPQRQRNPPLYLNDYVRF
ncbi:hypothetical protein P5673_028741 [Acropora cervicornis]|uniref:Reverse transcriptase domain-containing protein n=1 Tax=Acropora cervicornis TaxID=6130 RepID=A0AAD9PWW0_ACRCE|nr:hypothetical protein P5673_028741 [Acropora cervicornis]